MFVCNHFNTLFIQYYNTCTCRYLFYADAKILTKIFFVSNNNQFLGWSWYIWCHAICTCTSTNTCWCWYVIQLSRWKGIFIDVLSDTCSLKSMCTCTCIRFNTSTYCHLKMLDYFCWLKFTCKIERRVFFHGAQSDETSYVGNDWI